MVRARVRSRVQIGGSTCTMSFRSRSGAEDAIEAADGAPPLASTKPEEVLSCWLSGAGVGLQLPVLVAGGESATTLSVRRDRD